MCLSEQMVMSCHISSNRKSNLQWNLLIDIEPVEGNLLYSSKALTDYLCEYGVWKYFNKLQHLGTIRGFLNLISEIVII